MSRTEGAIHKLHPSFSCHTEFDPVDCKKQLRVHPKSQGWWVDTELGRIPIPCKEGIHIEMQKARRIQL